MNCWTLMAAEYTTEEAATIDAVYGLQYMDDSTFWEVWHSVRDMTMIVAKDAARDAMRDAMRDAGEGVTAMEGQLPT